MTTIRTILLAAVLASAALLQAQRWIADSLIESVRAYESGPCGFVMVDDGASDRKLATHFRFPSNFKPISAPHPRRQFPDRAARANRGKGICAAILQGLATVAKQASWRSVID